MLRWNAPVAAVTVALKVMAAYLAAGCALVVLWVTGTGAGTATGLLLPILGFLVLTTPALGWVVHRALRRALRARDLQDLISYDPVTSLPGIGLLASQVSRSMTAAGEPGTQLRVLAVHVDGLRSVNETLGPAAGDQLLVTVAERIRRELGPGELLARGEGSVFIVILTGRGPPERIEHLSDAMLRALAEPVNVAGSEIRPTASIGVSQASGGNTMVSGLVAAAGSALRRAREQGGWHVHHAATRVSRAAWERIRLTHDLKQVVANGNLELVFQPQVRLADREATGLESLARWNHPELGPVSPGRFLPLAEESGLAEPLGEWVLRQACRQAASWWAEGVADLRVTVNLSPRQFGNPRLTRYLEQVLGETTLPAARLEIEISESVLARDPEGALATLRRLKEIGVSLALDDFGAGYSSLSSFRVLPFDRLKLDRSFVAGLGQDPRCEALCRGILEFGRHLVLVTLAEGIETETQRRWLLEQGCQEGQGFLFARPMAALDVPMWLGVEPVRGERRPLSSLAV